jgi:carbon starvation protein
MHPQIKMPAVTQFIDGTGPIFGGKIFPFVFITIACGAISGFSRARVERHHAEADRNELDVRPIGYGSMMLESFVAVIALIAATLLDPGVYFAINSPPVWSAPRLKRPCRRFLRGVPGDGGADARARERDGRDQSVRTHRWRAVARGRHGDDLSVGIRRSLPARVWYHFAIMFEAVFILTTLDAGTRVGRFMLQDFLGTCGSRWDGLRGIRRC